MTSNQKSGAKTNYCEGTSNKMNMSSSKQFQSNSIELRVLKEDLESSQTKANLVMKASKKEKVKIQDEMKELQEDLNSMEITYKFRERWREIPTLVEKALEDLPNNIQEAVELKMINFEISKDIEDLEDRQQHLLDQQQDIEDSSQQDLLRNSLLRISQKYGEKEEVRSHIDQNITTNINQRNMILKLISKAIQSAMYLMVEEKVKYCDLKQNMLEYIQDNQQLELKIKELEFMQASNLASSAIYSNQDLDKEHNNEKEQKRTSKKSKKKKSQKQKVSKNQNNLNSEEEKANDMHFRNSSKSNPQKQIYTPSKTDTNFIQGAYSNSIKRLPASQQKQKSIKKHTNSIFKDKGLNISTVSHVSQKSNVSRRYDAHSSDSEDSDSSSDISVHGKKRILKSISRDINQRSNKERQTSDRLTSKDKKPSQRNLRLKNQGNKSIGLVSSKNDKVLSFVSPPPKQGGGINFKEFPQIGSPPAGGISSRRRDQSLGNQGGAGDRLQTGKKKKYFASFKHSPSLPTHQLQLAQMQVTHGGSPPLNHVSTNQHMFATSRSVKYQSSQPLQHISLDNRSGSIPDVNFVDKKYTTQTNNGNLNPGMYGYSGNSHNQRQKQ